MLYSFVVVPIFLSVMLYLFSSKAFVRFASIIAQFGLFIASIYLFAISSPDYYIYMSVGGFDGILGIILRADKLSATFVLLTTFLFLIATLYSFRESKSRLFWFLMFIWQGTLMGLFLTGDFFNIFVLMEVSTVAVAIMIMYNRSNRSLYDGMIYLMVNTIIIQFYLFGVGFIYRITGGLDLVHVQTALVDLERESLILPYALLMTFVALKCALIPLYGWLPKAHGTPGALSAVSALLSGLHIKSGVYLFLRFQQVFEPVAMPEIFLVIGLITAFMGVIMSVSQTDIKLVLAYSTIAQMGLIIVGFNISYMYSYNFIGSLYHIVNHAIFKSALFLSAGVITYAYGTRDITKIRGVFKTMPLLASAKILAIMGIIGTPLFNGSISKYFLMTGVDWQLNMLMIVINLGTIIIFMKYCTIFFGTPEGEVHVKTDLWRHIPILILGILCFVGGIFGSQAIELLFNFEVSLDARAYIEKSIIFFASLGAGFLIFKYFVQKSPLLEKVKEIDMSFRGMCMSMGVFLAVMLVTVGFFG